MLAEAAKNLFGINLRFGFKIMKKTGNVVIFYNLIYKLYPITKK